MPSLETRLQALEGAALDASPAKRLVLLVTEGGPMPEQQIEIDAAHAAGTPVMLIELVAPEGWR